MRTIAFGKHKITTGVERVVAFWQVLTKTSPGRTEKSQKHSVRAIGTDDSTENKEKQTRQK
jgi:hypothetical protein